MWPFKKRKRFYVNGHLSDRVKHAFQYFEKVVVVMEDGEGYIIKSNYITEDFEIIKIRVIDGERY